MANKQKYLVINADDIGFHVVSRKPVLDLARKGILASCSVIFSEGDAEEIAPLLLEANPGMDLGIHLNLTTGRPLSPAGKVPSIVGRDGNFIGLNKFLLKWAGRGIRLSEVRLELEAQFEKAKKCRVALLHVDGHHNIHLLPEIAKIASGLCAQAGIRWFRPSAATLINRHPAFPPNIKYSAFNYLTRRSRNHFYSEKLSSPDVVVQFVNQINYADITECLEERGSQSPSIIELVCHPPVTCGHPDLSDADITRRDKEFSSLALLDAGKCLENTGFEIMGRGNIMR